MPGLSWRRVVHGRSSRPQQLRPAAQQPKPAPSPEEKAVIDGVNAFSSLYSAANAEALAELFVDDASIIDPDGNETRARRPSRRCTPRHFSRAPA